MTYCKKCKIPAKDGDTVCARCGGPVSTFGSSSPAAGPAKAATATAASPSKTTVRTHSTAPTTATGTGGAMLTLGGKIRELEQVKERNLKRGRNLAWLCLLALVALLMVLYGVYSRTVLAYAVLKDVRLEQDEIHENLITVKYEVVTPGKVVFDRRSGTGRTEKVDVIAKPGPGGFDWAWPSDPKTGVDYSVGYRSGFFRTSLDRHFDVTRNGVGVDIVFLMDITSSMGPFIDGLKRNCNDFADEVRKNGVDCQLGLIGFGDVQENEPIKVYSPTEDVRKFQDRVDGLGLTNGGDTPESGMEAIEKALDLKFRPHTRVCFVHITDADCHNEQKINPLADQLKKRGIITYIVSRREFENLYSPLCTNGGTFHSIQDAKFEDILRDVARSITDQIRPR